MEESLYHFLCDIDHDFPTSLSDKVDLKEYAAKVTENATLFSVSHENRIIGCVVMYCNNSDDRFSYIPLVGVLRNYRKRHIAGTLLKSAIEFAKAQDFERVGIHTENAEALKLYLKLGFKVIEPGHRAYLELNLNNV